MAVVAWLGLAAGSISARIKYTVSQHPEPQPMWVSGRARRGSAVPASSDSQVSETMLTGDSLMENEGLWASWWLKGSRCAPPANSRALGQILAVSVTISVIRKGLQAGGCPLHAVTHGTCITLPLFGDSIHPTESTCVRQWWCCHEMRFAEPDLLRVGRHARLQENTNYFIKRPI